MQDFAMATDADALLAALHKHFAWQQRVLERKSSTKSEQALRFLILRPGDRGTVCTTPYLASGKCAPLPLRWFTPDPTDGVAATREHVDDIVIRTAVEHKIFPDAGPRIYRNLPGLGNIVAALASAAITAMLSRRILLVENWTIAGESFGPPLSHMLLGSQHDMGWAPLVAVAQLESRRETFLASDDVSLASTLCASNLRHEPSARVWRVFSNQYFLPLLWLNPHHRAQLRLWRPSWPRLVSAMLIPRPSLRRAIDTHAATARLGAAVISPSSSWRRDPRTTLPPAAPSLTMHLRCMQTLSGFCNRQQLADYSACARQRINATGARTIFIATMHQRDRQRMASLLKGSGAEVTYSTFAPAAERVQSGVKSQEDARVVDIWLVARGTELLLSPSSTMGYMSMALASPTAVITMLDKCLPRPSREATFHRIFSSTGHSANSTCRRALEQTRRMLPHEERSIPLGAFSESIQVFAFEEQDVAAKALLGRFAKQNFTLAHEIVARSVEMARGRI